MDTKNLTLIIIAVIHVLMATILILKNKRSPINTSFALVFYGAGLWTFGIAMFMGTMDMIAAIAWARIYYFAAAIIPVAFLFFAYYYLYKLEELDIIKIFYTLLPFLLVIVVIFHPTFFIEMATHYEWGNDANVKLLGHLIYILYFCGYVIWSYFSLFKKYKKADGVNKRSLLLVILGTLLSYTFGITFDLILPVFGNYKLIWIGPYFTLFTLIFLTYLIFYKPTKNI